jgi:hypothetical protein
VLVIPRAYIGQIERGEKNLGLINMEIAKALNIKIPYQTGNTNPGKASD